VRKLRAHLAQTLKARRGKGGLLFSAVSEDWHDSVSLSRKEEST
jgi:hypothetical protein